MVRQAAALGACLIVFACSSRTQPLEFPSDHGPHRDARSEWWYFTGQVSTDQGKTLGFEFTIFKRWIFQYRDFVCLGHLALSDPDTQQHTFAEVITPPPVTGMEQGIPEVCIRGFSYAFTDSGAIELAAETENLSLDVVLTPLREVLLHGEDGVVAMGDGLPSYYYSLTNLETAGSITINGEEHTLSSGRTWMDHQWGDFTRLAAMWDWFSLRFSDGGALMLTQHRTVFDRVCSAYWTYRSAGGEVVYGEQFSVEAARQYEDEQADCTYPVDWTIIVSELDAVFLVKPLFDEQSLYGVTTPSYWEGLCSVEGTLDNQAMAGSAYVELCGYENDQLIYTGPSS